MFNSKEKTDNIEPKENFLGTEKIGKLMWRFAIPAIISMLVNAVYNLIDQVLIGNAIGMLGIAATNVAFPLVTISAATALLLGIGGASNFNLRLGENNTVAAGKVAGNTLSLLAISGTIIGVVSLVFVNPLIFAFGATETIKPLALAYTTITAIGIPFAVFSTGACALIRADGSPRYAMWCMLAGALFNLVVDPIILFVFRWGIEGIAWSTAIGQMMSCAIAVYYFIKRTKTVPLKKQYLWIRAGIARKICALGMSSCVNQLGITAVQITMNNVLRHYGALSEYGSDIPLGSVGAISKLNILFLAVTIGIAQGCQPIHGYNYGAKKYARVKKTLRLAIIAASIVSMAAFIIFQLFPRELMAVFGADDPVYLNFAEHYLRVFMLLTFVNGIQPVTANFFTSIGKANRGMWISLTRQILFLLPLLLVLPLFFGLEGAIYAGPGADFAAAVLSALLIFSEVKRISALEKAQASAA